MMVTSIEIPRSTRARDPSQAPPEMFWVYRAEDRWVDIYAKFPINLILRAWRRRWAPVRALVEKGVMTVDEGDYYRNARIAPLRKWFHGRVLPGGIK